MGREGVSACLNAGVNDLGGSLMNESITRAAGSGHGQEWEPALMEAQIHALGRVPRLRTTLYTDVSAERRRAAFSAAQLAEVISASASKLQRSKRLVLSSLDQVISEASLTTPPSIPSFQEATLYESVVLMAACN